MYRPLFCECNQLRLIVLAGWLDHAQDHHNDLISIELTDRQLTKFDRVPGITVAYRHGPVTIYDISGLGIAELRSGWFKPTPEVRITTQLAVGLVWFFLMRTRAGLVLRAVGESPAAALARAETLPDDPAWQGVQAERVCSASDGRQAQAQRSPRRESAPTRRTRWGRREDPLAPLHGR